MALVNIRRFGSHATIILTSAARLLLWRYASTMNLLFDSFWRAAAYCLQPRVMLVSLMPLVIVISMTVGLGYLFWDAALDQVRYSMDSSSFAKSAWRWLEEVGLGQLKTVLAPLLVIFAVTPLIVLASLLMVAWLMTPAIVRLVAMRRFPGLQRQGAAASFLRSLAWSLGSSMAALLAMVVTIPLWLVPPLILVLPPLIWGWLAYRIMAFDALAEHASHDERVTLFARHRMPLLCMGVVCGFLGAAPSLVWASGALFAAAFVLLVPLAIWIYTLVFAFASLWFTHYCLYALQLLRSEAVPVAANVVETELPHLESP